MEYENLKNHLFEEIVRVGKIKNEDEKQKQSEKLDEKIRKMNELVSLQQEQKEQAILNSMEKRGIIKNISTLDSTTLKKKWEIAFAKGLTQDEKKQVYLSDFLWHIFSYKKVISMENYEARDAFNKAMKKEVIGFYQHKKDVLHYENAAFLKDTDFDLEDDIYLVDFDFHWTYVVTHEKGQCGPYFFTK